MPLDKSRYPADWPAISTRDHVLTDEERAQLLRVASLMFTMKRDAWTPAPQPSALIGATNP